MSAEVQFPVSLTYAEARRRDSQVRLWVLLFALGLVFSGIILAVANPPGTGAVLAGAAGLVGLALGALVGVGDHDR